MTSQKRKSGATAGMVLAPLLLACVLLLASCSRAPSFDIVGSFFPAWLICLILAIVLTVVARWLLLRLHIELALPVLAYPSLTALFTFLLWLVFFH
jgi:hypothetical protein